ncbi:methyltransferase [Methanocella sp. CWC-04]|uniref:Methyltransferase-like protein 5 n=1 Tax=Methanooceanicella nereidis TaxID=2052831 RepID=A0AAP2W813_9EURY|nr:METTL5 family protein [Methanocella sp. CWC-04]MCD1295616.1 methyltransferase [Methanocella sp. CWC-04]
MKKRKLEMLLEKVQGFERPDVTKEQYVTPAVIASELLYFAYMDGNLDGSVVDLGCGTGVLAIGASLLGTQKIIGIDSDINALKVARKNAEILDAHVDWVCCDVRDVHGHFDTVIMNPPFGAQEKGNDRPFLDKALEIGYVVYSIHNAGSKDFIQKYIKGRGTLTDVVAMKFPIRHTYKFHKKEIALIDVELYKIVVNEEKG